MGRGIPARPSLNPDGFTQIHPEKVEKVGTRIGGPRRVVAGHLLDTPQTAAANQGRNLLVKRIEAALMIDHQDCVVVAADSNHLFGGHKAIGHRLLAEDGLDAVLNRPAHDLEVGGAPGADRKDVQARLVEHRFEAGISMGDLKLPSVALELFPVEVTQRDELHAGSALIRAGVSAHGSAPWIVVEPAADPPAADNACSIDHLLTLHSTCISW